MAIKEKEEIGDLSPLATAGLTIFILLLFIGIFITVYGFPGTFVILTDVIICSWITGFEKIGLKIILILAVITLAAEAVDFYLGMKGAKKYTPSRTAVFASILGGIVGVILMTPVLLGLGTVIGIFLGGFSGVLIAELMEERKLKPAFRTSYGALSGRIAGVLIRGFSAVVMTVIAMSKIYS
ncbi:MAG: DUF456 domain-containing protein [Thermodesulfobacteriota bacterium]|nr:DUF456 domain-containing protein [Thermodesulfobacteriota bacterium]